jgi:hypothetical protein
MSLFAKVEDEVVVAVIVADQDFIDGLPKRETWIETCSNLTGGVLYDSTTGQPLADQTKTMVCQNRKNSARIGGFYDENADAFIAEQPFESWILNTETCLWVPPTPIPDDGNMWGWDESSLSWILVADLG